MELLIHRLLKEEIARNIYTELTKDDCIWKDGRATAGSYASHVKNNLQLDKSSKKAKDFIQRIIEEITANQLIKSFSLPYKVHGLRFAKTGEGQGYGMHVDNAFMSSGRSDLSFTIFLNDPTSYEGGELCIQSLQDNQIIKLKAGEIVIYPSTSLHSVEKVTKGERVVCVGWIQSYISSNEDRNLLFGLDAGAKGLLAENGRSDQLDLVFQAYNNLLRRLGG